MIFFRYDFLPLKQIRWWISDRISEIWFRIDFGIAAIFSCLSFESNIDSESLKIHRICARREVQTNFLIYSRFPSQECLISVFLTLNVIFQAQIISYEGLFKICQIFWFITQSSCDFSVKGDFPKTTRNFHFLHNLTLLVSISIDSLVIQKFNHFT